ncbi:MAG TPA: glycosyltransferase family 39 protein [Elusimicrobiota bacterium]|nr:glycosyltransferase family 39 protein [Elusimicrobiota bacterium]
MKKRLHPLLLAFLLPVALGASFVGRPCFVDDSYHLLMAKGLLEHPLRPYDFKADDAGPNNPGWEYGRPPRMVNPPLHHYLLALFLKAGGDRIWLARLGFLLLSGLSALLIFLLSQRFMVPPLPATVFAVLTPAFWLSSYSLLIDPTMLLFFLAALLFWIDGLRKNSTPLLVAAGLSMGAACLTKYTAALVVPLAFLWWLLRPREERRFRPLLFLGLPFLLLGLWSLWNVHTYGAPHLLASSKRVVQEFHWTNLLVFLTFFSGVFLFPLFAWLWDLRLARRPFLAAAGLTLILFALLAGPWGGFSMDQALLVSLLAGGGVLFFQLVAQTVVARALPSDVFLLLWLFLNSIQMIFIMGWFAGRYYLTVLPPAVFLFYRALQRRWPHAPGALRRFSTLIEALLFLSGLALATADHLQATARRRIVDELERDGWTDAGRRCFALGDSFTGDYLKAAGWTTAFPETRFQHGDLVLKNDVVMPAWWFRPEKDRFRPLKIYEYASRFPLRVMDNQGAAGFYASVWGALPFSFSRSPLERYVLLEYAGEAPSESPRRALPHRAGI